MKREVYYTKYTMQVLTQIWKPYLKTSHSTGLFCNFGKNKLVFITKWGSWLCVYHSLSYIQEKNTLTRELRPLNSRTSGFLWGVEQIGKIIAVTFIYGRTRQYSNISKNTEHGDTEVYLCYGCLGLFFLYF